MIKNMGLSVALVESGKRYTITPKKSDWDARVRNAEKDFADYAEQLAKPVKKRELQGVAKREIVPGKTYHCNFFFCRWAGKAEELTREHCPCCGQDVFPSRKR